MLDEPVVLVENDEMVVQQELDELVAQSEQQLLLVLVVMYLQED